MEIRIHQLAKIVSFQMKSNRFWLILNQQIIEQTKSSLGLSNNQLMCWIVTSMELEKTEYLQPSKNK